MNGKDLSTGQRNADSRPLLEIQLFGRFLAKIDGAAVEEKRWERRSAKALVKLLSLKPSYTLHREQIIDLLWPEQGAESPSPGSSGRVSRSCCLQTNARSS